jgi:transcription antitermination factor NusG
VAEILRDAGVGYYLPLNAVVYRDACGKRRTKRVPLFPGYVFIRCEPVTAYDVLAVCRKHLCGEPIRVSDQGGLTRDLSSVCTALAAGEVEQWPELVTGRMVRMSRGPFMGVEGYIEQRDDRHLLVIRIGILGQSVSVEDVNPEDVEAA